MKVRIQYDNGTEKIVEIFDERLKKTFNKLVSEFLGEENEDLKIERQESLPVAIGNATTTTTTTH